MLDNVIENVVKLDVVALNGGGRCNMRHVLHESAMSGISLSTAGLILAACKILSICFCEASNQ
eukprot:12888311-Prorocentrum_lima.AAC.1